jgi:streptomycin 6-kinase
MLWKDGWECERYKKLFEFDSSFVAYLQRKGGRGLNWAAMALLMAGEEGDGWQMLQWSEGHLKNCGIITRT